MNFRELIIFSELLLKVENKDLIIMCIPFCYMLSFFMIQLRLLKEVDRKIKKHLIFRGRVVNYLLNVTR